MESATKPMAIVELAERHLRTVLETSQQFGISSTHGAGRSHFRLPRSRHINNRHMWRLRREDCRRSKDHKCEDCGEVGHFARLCFNQAFQAPERDHLQQGGHSKRQDHAAAEHTTAFGADTTSKPSAYGLLCPKYLCFQGKYSTRHHGSPS